MAANASEAGTEGTSCCDVDRLRRNVNKTSADVLVCGGVRRGAHARETVWEALAQVARVVDDN